MIAFENKAKEIEKEKRKSLKKSFEITAEHFMECYGKKARFFVYNSSNLNQLDAFSSNAGLNVMIINTQAFAASLNEDKNVDGRKGDAAARIIFTARDSFGSRKPIDVIAANRPILILDEPQKMGNEKDSVTQKALRNFNPLFSLYYSATHKTNHNAVYALDALDAYNQRLVKKIEVKGFEVKNLPGTNQYLYLEDLVLSAKKPPSARIELEVRHKNGVKRELHLLGQGDNLYYISKEMEQYKGLVISEIDAFAGEVHFTNGLTLKKGNLVGDESKELPRLQIRETIISHLEKERQLFKLGIKTCLSSSSMKWPSTGSMMRREMKSWASTVVSLKRNTALCCRSTARTWIPPIQPISMRRIPLRCTGGISALTKRDTAWTAR